MINFRSTVLPHPDPPTMATISPLRMVKSMPARTTLPPKDLERFSRTTSGGWEGDMVGEGTCGGSETLQSHLFCAGRAI